MRANKPRYKNRRGRQRRRTHGRVRNRLGPNPLPVASDIDRSDEPGPWQRTLCHGQKMPPGHRCPDCVPGVMLVPVGRKPHQRNPKDRKLFGVGDDSEASGGTNYVWLNESSGEDDDEESEMSRDRPFESYQSALDHLLRRRDAMGGMGGRRGRQSDDSNRLTPVSAPDRPRSRTDERDSEAPQLSFLPNVNLDEVANYPWYMDTDLYEGPESHTAHHQKVDPPVQPRRAPGAKAEPVMYLDWSRYGKWGDRPETSSNGSSGRRTADEEVERARSGRSSPEWPVPGTISPRGRGSFDEQPLDEQLKAVEASLNDLLESSSEEEAEEE